MFGVPIEKIKKGNPEYALRQKGKVAELALGYQGGTGALIQMGALNMGLTEEELPDIVNRWRNTNKRIVDLWKTVQNAVVDCLTNGNAVYIQKGVSFSIENRNLAVNLPSGRQLFYVRPELVEGQYGPQITYMGQNQISKKWEKIPTYGGKLTENIIQAIARDCLAEALINLCNFGFKPVFHIHDEVICEVPKNDTNFTLEKSIEIMCQVPKWAEGLPLNADGFTCDYYKKD